MAIAKSKAFGGRWGRGVFEGGTGGGRKGVKKGTLEHVFCRYVFFFLKICFVCMFYFVAGSFVATDLEPIYGNRVSLFGFSRDLAVSSLSNHAAYEDRCRDQYSAGIPDWAPSQTRSPNRTQGETSKLQVHRKIYSIDP